MTKEQLNAVLVQTCATSIGMMEALREVRRCLIAGFSSEHCLMVIDQAFEKHKVSPGPEHRKDELPICTNQDGSAWMMTASGWAPVR